MTTYPASDLPLGGEDLVSDGKLDDLSKHPAASRGTPGSISVIIPAYNHEKFVQESVRSVLAQSRKPLEVIVVDDGSRDSTADAVASFGDAVTLLRRAHRGVRETVWDGLQWAQGTYVLLLGSDDFLKSDALQRLGLVLDMYPDVALAYGGVTFVNAAGNPLADTSAPRPYGKHWDPRRLMKDNYVPAPAALCRRSSLLAVGEPTFPRCGDWERWLRLALAGWYFYGIGDSVAYYRRHDRNTSKESARLDAWAEQARMLAALEVSGGKHGPWRRYLKEAQGTRYRAIGRTALNEGHKQLAIHGYQQALLRPGRRVGDIVGWAAALAKRI